MKKLFLAMVVGLFLPSLTWAADGRILYQGRNGMLTAAKVAAVACGTDSNGIPTVCGTTDTDARLSYAGRDGFQKQAQVFAPICGVDSSGIPQLCSFSTPDLSAYLTTAAALKTYAQLAARNSFTSEQQFANAYFADPDQGVSRDAKFGDRGIAVGGGTKTDTLTVTGDAATGALTVTGNIAEQGIPTFTNTSGQVTGALTGSTAKWLLSRSTSGGYTSLSTYASGKWVPFMFNDDATVSTTVGTLANLGADVEFTKTLTVDGATSVPDTATTDSSKSALNTESAAARFVSSSTAASTYETIAGMSSYALKTNGTIITPSITKPSIDDGTLTTDGNGNWVLSGNNGIQFGGKEWLNYNAADGYIAVNGDLEITGRVNLPTRTTGDNGNYAASTAFVQNTVDALQGSVTGDLSASGSSLTLPIGSSGLNFVMTYSASGTGALTAVSASGSLTPVDIYEVAAWGTTSFKGYTLDSGTITTTATTVDGTFYLTSNAVGTYHVGVGGNLYIVDIFGSGAGKRTFMSWRKVY